MKPKIILAAGFILTVAAITGLSGCQTTTKKTYTDPLDLSARDTNVRPQDNFFLYANGTWLKNTKMSADKAFLSAFNVHEELNERIKLILDSCVALKDPKEGSIEQQIGDLFISATDSAAINKAGLYPLQADLHRISTIKTPDDIIKELALEYKNGDWMWNWYHAIFDDFNLGQLCTLFVAADEKSSKIHRLHCNQGGLGLPNKTYYFKTDSTSRDIVKAYRQYISAILSLSGDTQPGTDANAIFSLEKKLAGASKTPVELRDPEANYHLTSVEKMNKLAPNIPWKEMLEEMDVQTDTLLVGQPEYYKSLSGLLKSVPVAVWKKYLVFHLVSRYSPWLSRSFADAHFDFYDKILAGRQKQQDRWKRVAGLINYTIGDDLGRLYVKRYFPPSSKAYMMSLVDNLKKAFRERIEQLTWMSDSTKDKAVGKLDAMVAKIGYPERWKDYSSVRISKDSLIGNLKQIGQWYYQYNMNQLHKPVDRSEWFMTPTTLNAYHSSSSNDINFPAAVFIPPYYYPHGDDALNYGAIGTIIGHEMTHGFDDHGSQFDKFGNLKDSWTKEDRDSFNKRAERIVKQFNGYTILDTIHLNGRLTEGENIADLGGEAIAYTAFQQTQEAHKDTLIDGLTPGQRFFMATAQQMRVKVRPQTLQTMVHSNHHSPWKYRLNGPLSNMPAFYKAFSVKPGDKMYRPDSVRVMIW